MVAKPALSKPGGEQPADVLNIHIGADSSMEKYPAKQHARNVARRLPTRSGLIYLEGMPEVLFEDSDEAIKFRQKRYFLYLTGAVDMPDCFVTYSIAQDKLILYIPPFDPNQVLWSGFPPSIEDCIFKYDVDEVLYSNSITDKIMEFHFTFQSSPIYTIHHQVSRIPQRIPGRFISGQYLQPAIDDCRVYKDDYEIKLLRRANIISANAHRAVLEAVQTAQSEAQLEGIFVQTCIAQHARTQAYEPIVGSGQNCATLHYTRNDAPLSGKQLLLIDAGAEWDGYASDVTRTYPISGKWTKEASEIYNIVDEMQKECIKKTVAGVDWRDTHLLAHRIAIKGLMSLGILYNGTAEEIFQCGTSRAFFPHGLGHFLGLDTHDVEGTPDVDWKPAAGQLGSTASLPKPMLGRGLYRAVVRRILEPRMVITVEPGIYFSRFIIQAFLSHPAHSQYINETVLEKYWAVGGVRIEDDILVLGNGKNENLTTAPRIDPTGERD
ncbi:peptidase M24, structural domain-containing protein [Tuber brumale]|nr:peptidase M24, structural domain-containing protein [Tuber brumale]